ncbi:RagB/SusD family nutrient uptake outer membrane protein [Sphingobacterium lactis]|uniref:RagB/SusD family nutrient uptake outer membrane protein n=1 Tax=Sphingobacterium lactis TaxID=797291 RepID=UPI003DA607D9
MNRKYLKYIVFSIAVIFGSCKKFLSEKPLSSLATLESLDDYKAIIQNEIRMNDLYPFCYDYSSDYFYLTEEDFNALDETGRNGYAWEAQPAHQNNWNQNFTRIYDANVVLDGVDNALLGNWSEADRREVKGTAYFFKAFTLLHLAAIYAPAYEPGKSHEKPGIPLRYSSDINEDIKRATLEETFRHIEDLLLKSCELLPFSTKDKTLPTKEAAWAALARHYLNMQDYERAKTFADSCLGFNDVIIDFNNLNQMATANQFSELNNEVIFHATKGDFSSMITTDKARVDTSLYDLYPEDDLRKYLFYTTKENGNIAFHGDYSGSQSIAIFSGLARDEVCLISAESSIRTGDVQKGIATLNKLLAYRISKSTFTPLTTSNQDDALKMVLLERRKELAFRAGLRWMDLKRLNLEKSTSTTLKRKIGNREVELEPNGDRYVFKIPDRVIAISGISQNP